MSELACPIDGPVAMVIHRMRRSLNMHKQWTDTYVTSVQQEADLYAYTSCMGDCHSIQEALAKFHAKREFLERAYAQHGH